MDGMSGCKWVIPQLKVHASAPEENPKTSISYRVLCSSGMSIHMHAPCSPTCVRQTSVLKWTSLEFTCFLEEPGKQT